MKPFFLHLWNALWNDEASFKRWMIGVLGFLVTLASMVFIDGVDVAFAWTHKQWFSRLATALIAMAFTMVNPTGKLPKALTPTPKGDPE